MLPKQWRTLEPNDICCKDSQNLFQAKDYNGNLIDGGWICSICKKSWVGNGKDKYLNHPLETLTQYGKIFIEACNEVILDGKHLCLHNVFCQINNRKKNCSYLD